MPVLVLLVAAVGVLVAVTLVARRLNVPVPVALVVVGVAISFVPGTPSVQPSPTLLLEVVLPPILYAAAVQVRVVDLRRDWAAVTALAVALVLVSAATGGALLAVLLPGIAPAAALAAGAVVSPPDAVAATAVGRRTRLPPRVLTLLEGEGLLNDATALVLLGATLTALGGAPGAPALVGARLLIAVVGSTAVGLLAGALSAALRVRLTDPVLDTAVSIAIPFAASAAAVALDGSGVLAVVVAGLYTGRAVRRRLSAAARTAWRTNWTTIQFLLENGVFLLIGLELRSLVADVGGSTPGLIATGAIGLLLALVLTAVRLLWSLPLLLVLNRVDRRRLRRGRVGAGTEFRARDAVVLGWAGMRGVVTLTAAQTLPASLTLRPQLVLVAFVVVAATLVLQGGSLGALIRRLHAQGPEADQVREDFAAMLEDVVTHGLAALEDARRRSADPDPEAVRRVRTEWERRVAAAREAPAGPGSSGRSTPERDYRGWSAVVVAAARDRLLEVRRDPRVSSSAVNRTQAVLDSAEQRLTELDEPG